MGGVIEGARLRLRRARPIRVGWWMLVLLPVAGVFALCVRPVMRLNAQPPAGFIEVNKEWDATRQSTEDRAARAYWQLAHNLLQWKYAFGTELPAEPVSEFRLDEKDFPRSSVAAAPATRLLYWKKLREVWPQRSAWTRTYIWNPGWLTELLYIFTGGLVRFTDRILRALEF